MSNLNLKEITITISYERRMKELGLMLSQCQLLEELLKNETITLQEKAKAVIEERDKQKTGEQTGEQNGGQ